MKVKCIRCGHELIRGQRYCPYCEAQQPPMRRTNKKRVFFVILIVAGAVGLLTALVVWLLSMNKERTELLPAARETAKATLVPARTTPTPTVQPSTAVPTLVPAAQVSAVPTLNPAASNSGQDGTVSWASVISAAIEGTAIEDGNPVITSREELMDLLQQMIEQCDYTVDLNPSSRVDEAMLESVTDQFPVSYWGWSAKDSWIVQITIEPYLSEKIWYAAQNGELSLLDGNEQIIYQKAQQIVSKVTSSSMTPYEKELAIHDYIVQNCEYLIDDSKYTGSVRGMFEYGYAQCSGYADAFNLLCRLAGLETIVCTGEIIEDFFEENDWTQLLQESGHAWNLICLDGKWYTVDCTWDDHDDGRIYYYYYNLPPKALDVERTWDSKRPDGQLADALDNNNWFVHNGCFASNIMEAENLLDTMLIHDGRACFLSASELDISSAIDESRERLNIHKSCTYSSRQIGSVGWKYEVTLDN